MNATIGNIINNLDVVDLTLLQILANRAYLEDIIKGFDDAILYRADNKEYYYNFIPRYPTLRSKKYTSFQLINLRNAYEKRRIVENMNYYLNKEGKPILLDLTDKILLILYITKYSYLKIFKAINNARLYRSDVKIFHFTYTPPIEVFGKIKKKIYESNYLLLLNDLATTQSFTKRYKNFVCLPMPHILNKKKVLKQISDEVKISLL